MFSLPKSLRGSLTALGFILCLANISACSDDGGDSVLLTCGDGVVEDGEECDDGGVCVGGPNAGARCQVGLSAGDDEPCTSTGTCSLALGGGTCRGPFQPELYEGKPCAEDSEASDCCPEDDPECGNGCIGECMGGAAEGDTCRGDSDCERNGSCVVDDTDSCTSICRFPFCGDGVVNVGLEQCDGFNLGSVVSDCAGLQLGEGTLRCSPECVFDTSACGPPFTATPTGTATSLPTETATLFPTGVATFTPTPTLMPSPTATVEGGAVCGDGLLELTENCTEPATAPPPVLPGRVGDPAGQACDQDCTGTACTAGTDTQAFSVFFAPPPAFEPTGVTLLVGYRASQFLIPGASINPMVRQRVALTFTPTTFFPNDREYALRMVVGSTTPVPEEFGTITFSVCDGAVAPSVEDLSCIVEACAGAGGTIEGCECAITEAAGG